MYQEFQHKLGKRIKALREMKGISQKELASMCVFEKSNMSRLEAGRTNPTVVTLLKISDALSVDLPDLVNVDKN